MMDLSFVRKSRRSSMVVIFARFVVPYNKGISSPPVVEIDPDLAEPELIPF